MVKSPLSTHTQMKQLLCVCIIALVLACATAEEAGHKYDVIVLGAGTAGCAIAARISENPDISVLLIGEGEDQSGTLEPLAPERQVARYNAIPLINPSDSVGIPTDVVQFAEKMMSIEGPGVGRKSGIVVRPDNFDGASGVNGGAFVFPPDEEYTRLSSLGITGWNVSDIIPLRKKIETFKPWGGGPVPAGHGTSGPIETRTPTPEVFLSIFMDSIMNVTGSTFNPDTGLGNINGTGYYVRPLGGNEASTVNGNYTRQGSCVRYLYPHRHRTNLRIETRAKVQNVGRKGSCRSNGKAACVNTVTYLQDGVTHTESIKKDGRIILSAGALESPKILMYSGIGDCAELAQFNIPCVYNSVNVGKKIYDHIMSVPLFFSTGAASPDWPLHRGAIVSTYLTLNTTVDAINAQISYTSYPAASGAQVILVTNTLTQPRSYGKLTPRTPDYGSQINITFGLMEDPSDMDAHVEMFLLVRKAAARLNLFEVIPSQFALAPGASFIPPTASRAAIAAAQVQYIKADYHTTGSAKMGLCSNGAVVDSKLEVCEVANLMVVDQSVWPFPYYGHTTHPGVLIIAERGAEFVLQYFASL